MSTIQKPTVCYFTLFLANTMLGRGDTGSMANADMAMITKALFPDAPQSPNLVALFLHHLCHQRNKKKGDICISGFVTHLVQASGIAIPIMPPVDSSILMDVKYITTCG